ncbi:MAG: tRNA adenosine(34) deaminase TadA [Arenicella sp.]|nr:tRNA adenosine(34) deaminase TadA [Arenicella sp.]
MIAFSAADERWMQRALELARVAGKQNEVPVGAVLIRDDKLLGEGSNMPISQHDTTAHAEIQAIRRACSKVDNYRLPDSTFYLTLEPCPMCAGAIIHARVQRVVIAAVEPRAGAAGSVLNILNNERLNHRCEVEFGLLQAESARLLKDFFAVRRRL